MDPKETKSLEDRLAEMGQRIEELRKRLGTVTGEVKAELKRRIDAASTDQEELRERLRQLSDAKLEQLDNLKEQAGNAWGRLERSLSDLAARFKK